MAARAEKRGPKIGDAASLWNFTPSPGWTKEEAHLLKLCLMKVGVGRWMQILQTGLLPGKLIQQLNGQTQRLLGQQSLAAFTGLQVDVDRIRADNEARTEAPRKGGLIINTGANLTKTMKLQLQKEARQKYELSAAQIQEVEEALAAIAAKRAASIAAAALPRVALMDSDASKMTRAEQVALLRRLHAKLAALHATLAAKLAGGAATSGQENCGANTKPPRVVSARGKLPKAGAKRKSAAAEGRDEEKFEEEERGDTDMAEAVHAASAADAATLVAMGFPGRQARDALEECGGDVEVAATWLLTNCV